MQARLVERALLAIVALLASTLVAEKAAAQLRGSVLDASGRPVPEALVELAGPAGSIAVTRSGANGSFHFSREHFGDAATMSVRRIGFQPMERTLSGADETVRVILEHASIILAPIIAEAEKTPARCPNRDDPDARARWEGLRARYQQQIFRTGFLLRGLKAVEHVSAAKVGDVDDAALEPFLGTYAVAQTSLGTQARETRYARRLTVPASSLQTSDGLYLHWQYAALEAQHAQFFIDDAFGRDHAFSVLTRAASSTTLLYCPLERNSPGIHGVLVVGTDTTLREVRWHFQTHQEDEGAGGIVWFASHSRDTSARETLVPERGVFWRRLGVRNRYLQVSAEYREVRPTNPR